MPSTKRVASKTIVLFLRGTVMTPWLLFDSYFFYMGHNYLKSYPVPAFKCYLWLCLGRCCGQAVKGLFVILPSFHTLFWFCLCSVMFHINPNLLLVIGAYCWLRFLFHFFFYYCFVIIFVYFILFEGHVTYLKFQPPDRTLRFNIHFIADPIFFHNLELYV